MDNGYAKTYWGNFDMRAFGLYRTTVGYDTGNDMMENVTTLHSEREAKREEARIQAEKKKKRNLQLLLLIITMKMRKLPLTTLHRHRI